jgi:hypothetical protein
MPYLASTLFKRCHISSHCPHSQYKRCQYGRWRVSKYFWSGDTTSLDENFFLIFSLGPQREMQHLPTLLQHPRFPGYVTLLYVFNYLCHSHIWQHLCLIMPSIY